MGREQQRSMVIALSLVVLMGAVGVFATIAFLHHGPLALPVNPPPAAQAVPSP